MNWDLSKLYAGFDDPKLHRETAEAFALLTGLRAAIDELSDHCTPEGLAAVLETLKRVEDASIKIGSFTFLTLAVDANNEDARAYYDRVNDMDIERRQTFSALSRLLGRIDDLDAFIAGHPVLEEHAFLLRKLKQSAAHVIDPALEPTVLRMPTTGGSAWSRLRNDLDANLMIPFEKDGKSETLPLSAIRGLAYDASADVRRRAYEAEISAYPRIEIPMAACLNGIKGEGLTTIQAEHFDSILDQTLFNSNMDRATLDAMLTAMKESLPAFRRYLRKKGEILGHKNGIPFYDLFAPIAPAGYTPKHYTIEEAREKLIYEMSKFTPDMGKFIDEAFENRWIDVFPREGKGGGAFCAGVPHCEQSRVLTNFTGSLGDVMKESAHLALTYARVHAETYHIAPDKFKNTDIHIHAPEGAVPKDGPSAGVTLTTALISALSEIPVRHDLAMTGEITLHGNVLPIGGLKEKSMAAFREGISTVLIPEANKPDLYEVDEEVKKAVKFIPVSDLSQVLKHALILPAASAAHKRTMPQATQLIATEQSTAKEPAAVM